MDGFCYKTARIWQLIGYVLLFLKIAIPLVIIILGTIDFGKAVVSSDEKAIQKSGVSLAKRVLLGIIIFFVPTLVNAVFAYIKKFNSLKGEYLICLECVTKPNSCDTSHEPEYLK